MRRRAGEVKEEDEDEHAHVSFADEVSESRALVFHGLLELGLLGACWSWFFMGADGMLGQEDV